MDSINFFHNQNKNAFDQFIDWSLSYGRMIVMLTEVIALGAFLYRFGLDRQLVDLHDSIKRDQAFVSALQTNETTYRNLQDRLTIASHVDTQAQQILQNLLNTMDLSNGNVTFTIINDTTTALELHVLSDTSTNLNTFITTLENSPYVDSVNIASLTTSTQTQQLEAEIDVTLHTNQLNL